MVGRVPTDTSSRSSANWCGAMVEHDAAARVAELVHDLLAGEPRVRPNSSRDRRLVRAAAVELQIAERLTQHPLELLRVDLHRRPRHLGEHPTARGLTFGKRRVTIGPMRRLVLVAVVIGAVAGVGGAASAAPPPTPAAKLAAERKAFRTYLAFVGEERIDYRRAFARFGATLKDAMTFDNILQASAKWEAASTEVSEAASDMRDVAAGIRAIKPPAALLLANTRLAKSASLLAGSYDGMAAGFDSGASAATTLDPSGMATALLKIKSATTQFVSTTQRAAALINQWRAAVHGVATRLRTTTPIWVDHFLAGASA